MERFFTPKPVFIGKRKDFPDSLPNMLQEDHIVVFLAGKNTDGLTPMEWVDEHIHEPLRERSVRNKKTGRYK